MCPVPFLCFSDSQHVIVFAMVGKRLHEKDQCKVYAERENSRCRGLEKIQQIVETIVHSSSSARK
jgi:hypothetical protein